MPAIFISQSSLDPQIADDIKTALDRLGFEKVFLDFNKETGIGAGEGWEKRLYEELSRCHAVILVLTPNWLAARWCRIELAQAQPLRGAGTNKRLSALHQRRQRNECAERLGSILHNLHFGMRHKVR